MAKTLNQAVGIVGKKGVLWWEIHRLLTMKRPPYLFLENVDRLLKSPTSQRGRDFGVMLATLANLGYEVEWRVVNAADYGFPQKRRRVLIVGRLAGEQPRDPNEVIYRGTLARALPIEPGPTLSSSATFKIEGDAAEVSETFGATKGESPFRNAGYMSHRQVWTLDVDSAWEGPRQVARGHPRACRRTSLTSTSSPPTSCRAGSTSRAPSASSATTRARTRPTSTSRAPSPTPTGPTGHRARS